MSTQRQSVEPRPRGAARSPAPPLQAKLKVGGANDPLEREADDIADRVMRMPHSDQSLLQRCPGGCPGDEELRRSTTPRATDPPGVSTRTERAIDRHLTTGAPLPAPTRRFFEPRFGARLDGIRVHTDADSARLAQRVRARAFTVGRDIFFGPSEYQPGSTAGQRLLAHELAHTVQQSGRDDVQRQPEEEAPPSAGELYETYEDDPAALGKELYRLVSESPSNAGLALDVLDKVPWLYRDDVAYYFVYDNDLLTVASDEQGRTLLNRLRTEMEGGAPLPSEKAESRRIDEALEATTPIPELIPFPLDTNAPPFPLDVSPISDLEGRVTIELYTTLRTAWSWLESDPSTTRQLLTSIHHTVETMRPLIECVSARGDNSAVKDLDELRTELDYAIEQLTDQTDHSFDALRQNFEWIALALVDLDPMMEGFEQVGSVGSCVAVVLGPFAEGILESLRAIDPVQVQRFSSNLSNNPFFGAGFTLGAQVGILIDVKEVVFSVLAAVRHPVTGVQNLGQDLHDAMQQAADLFDELTGPTGADAARGIGRGIGAQFGTTLVKLNETNGPFMFAYELGNLVGPAIIYTVLSLLGFEGFVAGRVLLLADDGFKALKGFPRLASLFKGTPDAVPLPGGTPEGGPVPTPGAPEASAPTPTAPEASRPTPVSLDDIIRADGIPLPSGHRIRVVDGMLVRCTDCSVLARVYGPVLQHPGLDEATAGRLLNQIEDLQREVDQYLAGGFSKEDVLHTFADRIKALENEIDGHATRLGLPVTGKPSADLVTWLEKEFGDEPEAVRLLLEEGQGFAETLVSPGLGKATLAAFKETWRRRHGDPAIRAAVIEVMLSGAPGNKVETALRGLNTAPGREPLRGEKIAEILGHLGAVRAVRVVPGKPWRNPNPEFLTAEGFTSLPAEGLIGPHRLRYGQRRATFVFDDGRTIQELVDELTNSIKGPNDVAPADITLHEGKVYTLSHRRVIAFQAAAMRREGLEIRYRKREWDTLTAIDQAKVVQTEGNLIRID